MNDRRRINGPAGGTAPLEFAGKNVVNGPSRARKPNSLRKMFLKNGITPSASGSAYLELESTVPPSSTLHAVTAHSSSGLKLSCTVHGPRPLPRSAPFSPHIVLATHVKYAPFANRKRRGYVRDSSERDLSVHLETALRGVIIGDRWPKSAVEVIVTILEGEEDTWLGHETTSEAKVTAVSQWGLMSVLGGCITVASAAIADAGIDCVDLVSGGVAAVIREQPDPHDSSRISLSLVLDPTPSEHWLLLAACVVAYLPSRDEITNIWVSGEFEDDAVSSSNANGLTYELLADGAIQAARRSHEVLKAALRENLNLKLKR